MNWLAKIAAMRCLGALPGGMSLYTAVQRSVTRSTVPTRQRIDEKLNIGREYLRELRPRLTKPMTDVVHVDVGAGWMPTIPLLFHSLSVKKTYLLDLRKNMVLGTVSETARLVAESLAAKSDLQGFQLGQLPAAPHQRVTNLDEYFEQLRMEYRAPYDLSQLGDDDAWKLVTCTQVLLHLRREQLAELMTAAARLIRRGGLFMATVHLYDLYSDTDSRLSRFNKYRYSDWMWNHVLTTPMMYFNRLTVSDYRAAASSAGLRILSLQIHEGTPQQVEEVKSMKLHRGFHGMPVEELAAQRLLLVADSM